MKFDIWLGFSKISCISSIIQYPVDSDSYIQYYLVHYHIYQLPPNSATTHFYGIKYFLLVECTPSQQVNDIKLTWQT